MREGSRLRETSARRLAFWWRRALQADDARGFARKALRRSTI